jgi:uncharacterized membrane protein
MPGVKRIWRHLGTTRGSVARAFSTSTLAAIEQAIRASELTHSAEIRFVLEPALAVGELWAGLTPRARALQLFASLDVWDTQFNNGVLVYVLFADHAIEIVADRGFSTRVDAADWRALCALAEGEYRAGSFEAGSVRMIEQLGALAGRHFPPQARDLDELPNTPLIL